MVDELLMEKSEESLDLSKNDKKVKESKRQPLIWTNIIVLLIMHIIGVYSLIAYIFKVKFLTIAWSLVVGWIGGFGATAGAHRLWSHNAFKAKLPLQLVLLACFSVSGQNSVYHWVRNHRIHHKYSDTDADPHNSRRGFFFSHIGWLMQKRHPEVLSKGKLIDMSDITGDPLLAFHTKYYAYFMLLFCFILPSIAPALCWNETWFYSIFSQVFVRYILNMHFTWSVNSVAHLWGNRPYDSRIDSTESKAVSIMTMGEGWHNYHHTFPGDYKAAELGDYKYNVTTMFIDFFAKIGWAYDLKTASKELVRKIVEKHGDTCDIPELPFSESGEKKIY